MFTVLLWWIVAACAVFLVVCAARALKFARAPEHLRWDLYPVAHEPGRAHGGGYLEEKDWWTKPRKKSHFGEIAFMAFEILLLKGVWENNRSLWWGSLPFHWGLYILMATTVGLLVATAGYSPAWLIGLLTGAGLVGGVLTAIGALLLFLLRSSQRKLKAYTTVLDKLNLLLLVCFGALSAAVATSTSGMAGVIEAMRLMVRFQPPEVSSLLAAQMAVAALFILYMPFTRMIHFFTKYFTYHQVRWDDRPVKAGSKLERRLRAALEFGVDWSAEHVRTGKTWGEVATTLPEPEKKN